MNAHSPPYMNRLSITLAHKDREILEARAATASLPVGTLAKMLLTRAIDAVARDDKFFYAVLVGGSHLDASPELEQEAIAAGLEQMGARSGTVVEGRARRPGKAAAAIAKKPAGARPKRRARK